VASPNAGNPGAGDPVPVASTATGSVARLININTATASELQLIKGIGPVIAGRIIEYRQANGPFTTLDDLDDVSGIGPKTIAKLVSYATAE
jgi:competence protein ComEA